MTLGEIAKRLEALRLEQTATSCGCLCICNGEPRMEPMHPADLCDLCRVCREVEELTREASHDAR